MQKKDSVTEQVTDKLMGRQAEGPTDTVTERVACVKQQPGSSLIVMECDYLTTFFRENFVPSFSFWYFEN